MLKSTTPSESVDAIVVSALQVVVSPPRTVAVTVSPLMVTVGGSIGSSRGKA